MSDEQRAVVDREECMGFGFCAEALPEVFRIDDEGKSTVLAGAADGDDLEAVADDCPRGAISLESRSAD